VKYQVILDDLALDDLADPPSDVRRRLWRKLEALAENPRPSAATALTGELRGFWRLRVGDYRASYSINEKSGVVRVWNAGHRSRFYERITRRRG
jgi:mRNA interferase RelE/StbE